MEINVGRGVEIDVRWWRGHGGDQRRSGGFCYGCGMGCCGSWVFLVVDVEFVSLVLDFGGGGLWV